MAFPMAKRRDTDDEAEARRILRRVEQETQPERRNVTPSFITRMENPQTDPHDPVEQWGIRIGRAIGFALTVGLVLWFLSYLVRG